MRNHSYKQAGKKPISMLLTVVMVLGLFTGMPLMVNAAGTTYTPTDWANVQTTVNGMDDGDTLDLSSLPINYGDNPGNPLIVDLTITISKTITVTSNHDTLGLAPGSAINPIYNLYFEVQSGPTVTFTNLVISSRDFTKSIVSGTGSIVVENVGFSTSFNDDTGNPPAQIDVDGDVLVKGTFAKNADGYVAPTTFISGIATLVAGGVPGAAIKANNVTVEGGIINGGAAINLGAATETSGNGIEASGNVTVSGSFVQLDGLYHYTTTIYGGEGMSFGSGDANGGNAIVAGGSVTVNGGGIAGGPGVGAGSVGGIAITAGGDITLEGERIEDGANKYYSCWVRGGVGSAESGISIKFSGNSSSPRRTLTVDTVLICRMGGGAPADCTILMQDNDVAILEGSRVGFSADGALPLFNGGSYQFINPERTVGTNDGATPYAPSANVCKIGATGYPTFAAAVDAATTGQTILMLANYTETTPIVVDGKTINLDLGSYTLLIDTSATALTVENGGKLNLTGSGTGKLNVKSEATGVEVDGTGSEATVNNVEVTDENCTGAYVSWGGTVNVNGNISAEEEDSCGISVWQSGTATVVGNITAAFEGVDWFNSGGGVNITVNGNVTVLGLCSGGASDYFEVEGVGGNTGTVTVNGNVTVYGGEVPWGGAGVTGVYCNGGLVAINGDVYSDWTGAQANTGQIIIEGTLTALGTPFVRTGSTNFTFADAATLFDTPYYKFTSGANYVWAKDVSDSLTDAQRAVADKAMLTWNVIKNTNTDQNNVTGNLTLSYTGAVHNSGIVWSSSDAGVISNSGTVTRPAGGSGDKIVTLTATITNGTATETVVFIVTVKAQSGGTNTAPTLTGPTTMTLTVGYAATSTGVYTVGGSPTPTVTKTSGDAKITWNNTTKKLDIATGLAVGSYPVVITASNGTLPNATLTFTLKVESSGGGGGGSGGSSATNTSITPTKADFDKNGGKDISVTLSKGSHTLQNLKNGSYTLKSGTDYTVSGNTITIKASYLNTLVAGSQTITFDMSGGTDPKLTVTVKDSTPAKPEAWKNPFTDVKEGAWYYDAVKYVYENGLIIGTAADKFSPNSTLTRGMIVTILYRLAREPDVSNLSNPFDDVAAGMWYTDAIKWAADNGIVLGYGNGKFGPNDPVTKEQLVAVIYRTQQADKKIPPTATGKIFTDMDRVSAWATEAVNALNNQGIFKDIPGDNFNPQTPASRAEVAYILYRYLTAAE